MFGFSIARVPRDVESNMVGTRQNKLPTSFRVVRVVPFFGHVSHLQHQGYGARRLPMVSYTILEVLHLAKPHEAPTIKKKGVSIRSRASKPSSQSQLQSATGYPSRNDTFKTTKEDKRRIKHSSLISRIEKSSLKVRKRRRPSKKLITNLESLVDALPEVSIHDSEATVVEDARIRQRSLKSKPGAMKKKERLEKLEMDRFNKNMAQMAHAAEPVHSNVPSAEVTQVEGVGTGSAQRWAALRSHIQSSGYSS